MYAMQDSNHINGNYTVLEVDKDCVRMSTFIEAKLKCKYEDGKAFYEAGKEEDLLYYRKILRPQKQVLEVNFVLEQNLMCSILSLFLRPNPQGFNFNSVPARFSSIGGGAGHEIPLIKVPLISYVIILMV